MDIDGGEQTGMSQFQSKHKKRHIYLTDSHEEAIVIFACSRGLLTAASCQSVNHYIKLMQSKS